VDVALHRIEALPGSGRYAVTFRGSAGDQTSVVGVDGDALTVAEANLPDAWTSGTAAYENLAAAVLAVHRARAAGPPVAAVQDVDGGWDVALGNVVLEGDVPACTAHGMMQPLGDNRFECADCGARAALSA